MIAEKEFCADTELIRKDAVIIGAGPAGLAAAVQLYKQGIRDLGRFGESLSGPEYAQIFIDEVEKLGIPYETGAAVTRLTKDRLVQAVTRKGLRTYQAKAVILAMGCKERTRGALGIPGERPAGVFTAGTAQAYMNLYNRMPGREVVILGSGDIGMIMARRLTLEGAHVQAVLEIMPYPAGLPRNILQCLDDYNIPLYLRHTVTCIHGKSRLTGVTAAQVDGQRRPIPGTEKEYSCDTLIGVFSAGNVLHVHDLVDFVSLEAEELARHAAEYIQKGDVPHCGLDILCGDGIGHVVPQKVSGERDFHLSLRVRKPMRGCRIVVRQNGREAAVKTMKKAIPAEMIQFQVPAGKLDRFQ